MSLLGLDMMAAGESLVGAPWQPKAARSRPTRKDRMRAAGLGVWRMGPSLSVRAWRRPVSSLETFGRPQRSETEVCKDAVKGRSEIVAHYTHLVNRDWRRGRKQLGDGGSGSRSGFRERKQSWPNP